MILGEYRDIPREARLLIFLSFVPSMVLGFIYTDLSYFLTKVQGFTDLEMGITLGTMAVSMVVASFPLGILADMYGRRKMLIIGNLAASLSLVGFALTTNLSLLLLVAVLEGIGEAAFAVSATALLADKAGNAKRTVAFSLQAMLGWISGALGAFLISSVLVLQSTGLSVSQAHLALYLLIGLLGLSVTPFILKVRETEYSGERRRREFLPKKSGPILIRFTIYSSAIALGAGLFVPLMTRWFSQAYGVTDAVSGPVLGASSILTAVAVIIAPRLATRFGLVRAIVMTEAISTVFMVLVPSSPNFGTAASLYTVRVFMMNLSNPLSQSLIMGLVSPDERGMASGINAALWRLPNAASSTAGAYMIGLGLLALPFYIATVLYLSAITMFWLLFKDTQLPEELHEIPQLLSPTGAKKVEVSH
jgi:MFS family permease